MVLAPSARPFARLTSVALILSTVLVAGLAAPAPIGAETLVAALGASLEIADHPAVEHYAGRYMRPEWRPWLEATVRRGAFYADHILRELRRRDLPAELLLLPAIESEFVGAATSSVGAAGLWQLMEITGTFYGLETNEVIDERRDFWKATEVALQVLVDYHRDLGSWDLALAAYNAGPTRIRRAMRDGGSSDFWELRRRRVLPRQTAEFVPRFYGVVRAVRALPEQAVPRTDELPRWRRITAPQGMDLRVISQLADVPLATMRRANAELRHGVTPARAGAQPYRLKIPEDAYLRVAAALADPDHELLQLQLHTVRTGDTLSGLAEHYQVSLAVIEQYNRGVDPLRLQIGAALLIPLAGQSEDAMLAAARQAWRSYTSDFTATHIVRTGDSLWSIAQEFRTTVEALAAVNDVAAGGVLRSGLVLRVPGSRRLAPDAAAAASDGRRSQAAASAATIGAGLAAAGGR